MWFAPATRRYRTHPFAKNFREHQHIGLILCSNREHPRPKKIATLFCNPACHSGLKWQISGEDAGGCSNTVSPCVHNSLMTLDDG